jgi:hypothetical protein
MFLYADDLSERSCLPVSLVIRAALSVGLLSSLVAPEFSAFHRLSTSHPLLSMSIPCYKLDISHSQRHQWLNLWMLRRFC